MLNTRCAARQYSDQRYCAVCRLTWDTNDPDPPPCGRRVGDKLAPLQPRLQFASGQPFEPAV